MNIFACFAPIDEGNTVIYLRFYQRFLTAPVLSWLVNTFSMPFNKIVLRQDKRVVVTQQPIRTDLHMGEALVQGDRPIVEFRRRRQALQKANPRPSALRQRAGDRQSQSGALPSGSAPSSSRRAMA